MLLYDDTTLLSPSRNSSPDIILTVANLDIRQSDDGGDPMQPKAITIATILTSPTNNFLDDDTRNVEEGKRTTTGEQSHRQDSRSPLRDEVTNDGNSNNPSGSSIQVPPPTGVVAPTGTGIPQGLLPRGGNQQPGHGAVNPLSILPRPAPSAVLPGEPTPTTMGGTTTSPNPHPRELERHIDDFLQ